MPKKVHHLPCHPKFDNSDDAVAYARDRLKWAEPFVPCYHERITLYLDKQAVYEYQPKDHLASPFCYMYTMGIVL